MIHKTNFQARNIVQSGLKGVSPEELKLLLAKYAQELLSKLQKGDIIEGKILSDENQQYSLFLKQGGKIPVSLVTDTEIGKEIPFIVENNEKGKVTLRPLEQTGESIVGKVIENLRLPDTPEMKDWVDTFIQRNFPLKKEVLLQSHYLEKNFELPKEVITQFLEKAGMLDSAILEKAGALKNKGLFHVIGQIKQLVQQINNPQVLQRITDLFQAKQPSDIQETLFQQRLPITTGEFSYEEGILKQNLPQEDLPQSNLLKENIEVQNKPLEFQSTERKIELLLQQKKEKIYQLIDKNLFFDANSYQNMSKEEQHENAKKMMNTYKDLANILNLIEEESLSTEQKEVLVGVRESVMSLGKVNHEANYFIFPMLQKDQEVQAEVYFFKPKKAAGKRESQVYAVVALDLIELKHIEVHVKKQEKVLELAIHTENKDMERHIIKHIPHLQQTLEGLGYTISQCSYHLFKDAIIQKDTKDIKDILRSLDLKV